LLDQPPTSGHVLVALIWEGGGLAAHVLADVGLGKGTDEDIRERLVGTSDSQRGVGLVELQYQAAVIAADLGHDYVGTEHQLLAIAGDEALGHVVLAAEVRQRAAASVNKRLP
jgi:hypothetical protein